MDWGSYVKREMWSVGKKPGNLLDPPLAGVIRFCDRLMSRLHREDDHLILIIGIRE